MSTFSSSIPYIDAHLAAIVNEADRAKKVHGPFPAQHLRSMSILTKEVMEAMDAALSADKASYTKTLTEYKGELVNLLKEVTQVAAVCILWLDCIQAERGHLEG